MKKLFTQLSLACALLVPIAASAFVMGPTTPGKWGSPIMGTGATVTWSLMATGTSCTAEAGGCSVTALQDFMPSGFLTHIVNAFASWSAVANINFTQVADDGAPFNAATTSVTFALAVTPLMGQAALLPTASFRPSMAARLRATSTLIPPNNGNWPLAAQAVASSK